MNGETDTSFETEKRFIARHRLVLSALCHALLFALALFAAFLLAYNFTDFDSWLGRLFLSLLLLSLPIKLAVFYWTRQFDTSWRYVSLRDLFGAVSASLVSSFLFIFSFFLIENLWGRSHAGGRLIDLFDVGQEPLRQSSVFPLDWVLTVVFICAAKVLVRFYHEEVRPERPTDTRRLMIVGAGDAGEALLRELLRMPQSRYECVGFVDDQATTQQGRIHGVPMLGRTSELGELCLSHDVVEVLIALPQATPKVIRELVEQCEGIGVHFRTVPPMSEVIEGRVQVSQVRDVDIADLLGREPVELDTDQIAAQLKGQRVLVTGGGGSIGSEMCRQIAAFGPQRLVLVEQAENNLFEIDRELRRRQPSLDIVPYVADIVDVVRLAEIFKRERPSIVFHAAAHKHVPMMEINPGEAIKNNVTGTMCVADACVEGKVGRMVMISTDKAVNPTSVMGCTKRVAEMYVQGLSARSDTEFITVRFGNVLGSSGSVVPIFKDQIARGGPVTVTDAEMTRYFMTIAEASQLVLQAGAMGKGGEIYVLHMGEPVKIVDLARDMITLSGLRPGIDIEIEFCGVRPGEKLFEELLSKGEHVGDTAHPKIGIWKHRYEDFEAVCAGITRLKALVDVSVNGAIQNELQALVPEYRPFEVSSEAAPA